MPTPVTCHMLIGPQGSGKSTLAEAWVKRDPSCVLVSTDALRTELYGDESHQGSWDEIEAQVVARIQAAVAQGKSVIYDATNARRGWRIGLLQQFTDCNCQWVGWWFKDISLEECKVRNQARSRQVSEAVLEATYQALQAQPPTEAEGLEAVWAVPPMADAIDWEKFDHRLARLPRTQQQRRNHYGNISLHPYSALLDFERLLHLMATLIQYPGLGALHQKHPEQLKTMGIHRIETITSEIDEIQRVLAYHHGDIYADTAAIRRDLTWLEDNGIVNSAYSSEPLHLPELAGPVFLTACHAYGSREDFDRLMTTFRFIAHQPSIYTPDQGSLKSLVQAMDRQDIFSQLDKKYNQQEIFDNQDDRQRVISYRIRQDIQRIFKPYNIMPPQPASQGYFLGTGILSKEELTKIFEVLQGNTQHIDDPMAIKACEIFRDRIKSLKIDIDSSYPVRTILHRPMVDLDQMASSSTSLILPRNAEKVEEKIRTGMTVSLQRLKGTGRFKDENDDVFQVLPLQIGFYNLGWYLGYQRLDNHLLRFERLDRLQLLPSWSTSHLQEQRLAEQKQARKKLNTLINASYGVYLGNSPEEQRRFLSKDRAVRESVEITLELWFTEDMFCFISEGTQRFPGRVNMSPRVSGATMSYIEKKNIFTLKETGDSRFPHRFRACLPIWVLRDDVQFCRWILGYAGEVKVISPDFFLRKIAESGTAISKNYPDIL